MKRMVTTMIGLAASVGLPVLVSSVGTGAAVSGATCMAMDHKQHEASQGSGHADDSGTMPGEEVVCALDGMKMKPSADTPSAQHQGKTYYFCSGTEKETFLQNPDRYVGR